MIVCLILLLRPQNVEPASESAGTRLVLRRSPPVKAGLGFPELGLPVPSRARALERARC